MLKGNFRHFMYKVIDIQKEEVTCSKVYRKFMENTLEHNFSLLKKKFNSLLRKNSKML